MKARVAEPAPRSWPEENQVWLAVGKAVVRRPASVLMASLVMLSPFALIACNSSSYSALPSQIIPDATPAGQALHELGDEFASKFLPPKPTLLYMYDVIARSQTLVQPKRCWITIPSGYWRVLWGYGLLAVSTAESTACATAERDEEGELLEAARPTASLAAERVGLASPSDGSTNSTSEEGEFSAAVVFAATM